MRAGNVHGSQDLVLNEIRRLREQSTLLANRVGSIERKLRFVVVVNPWGSLLSQTSYSKTICLRDALLKRYKKAQCLLTGVMDRNNGRDKVVAAHLFPRKREDEFFQWQKSLQTTICSGIDHPPNGMFLLKDVEDAYDSQKICFLCNPTDFSIRLKVLDPELRLKRPTGCSQTFQELEGKVIKQPMISHKKRPSFRILSYHAQFALDEAEIKGWLTREEREGLDTFIHLSLPPRK